MATSTSTQPRVVHPNADVDATFEARLRAARPRVLALARLRGLAADDAEEVAQEALMTAWRARASLRDSGRFDAWLDGICRNLCLRVLSARARTRMRLVPLDRLPIDGDAEALTDDFAPDEAHLLGESIPDGLGDLAEELCQADLHTLLDRALAHLSAPARAAIVLSYLDEVPQREAALRLGLTTSALEARLHRARAELRQALAGPLRAEAESFGLLAGQDVSEGWRESREWCIVCGQHRMRGMFETMPDGKINLRMRCPACSPRLGNDIVTSYGMIPLDGLRSFRPALARMFGSPLIHSIASKEARCPICGGMAEKYVRRGLGDVYMPERFWIACDCPRCGRAASWLANAMWARRETRAWMTRHPRHVLVPDTQTTFQGRSALRIRLQALSGAAQLDTYIDPNSLTAIASMED